MAKRTKRHTASEIASKLNEASALAAQGQTQVEIARALGVSVMTFHRWRKAAPPRVQLKTNPSSSDTAGSVTKDTQAQRQVRIVELQLENTRLRKLATDLLLERMRLEEEAKAVGWTGDRLRALR